jgi:hypothetical protein
MEAVEEIIIKKHLMGIKIILIILVFLLCRWCSYSNVIHIPSH